MWVTPDAEAKLTVKEALRRGYKKIAIAATTQDGMLSARDSFLEYSSGQLEIELNEEFPPELKDFKSFIAKLRNLNELDGLCLFLMPGQLGVFAKQVRNQRIDLPLFGIESFEDINEVKVAEGALDGQWYVSAADPGKSFMTEYHEHFPNAATWGAANAHDIALLIGAALQKGSSRKSINDFLHNLKDFTGALGTYSSTADNRFTLPASVRIVPQSGN